MRPAGIRTLLALAALTAALAGTPASAQPEYPEIVLDIYRVQAVDLIDPLGAPSLYYYVGVRDGTDWVWRGPMTLPDGPDLLVNASHTFAVRAPVVGVAVVLCEADSLNADDATDLSARLGGGADDNGCPLSSAAPPDYAFQGAWDLAGNGLTGDTVLPESGYWRTSGDFDGSGAADENDASLWFRIADAYEPPTATLGSDRWVGAGEIVSFDGGPSRAWGGSSIESYAWDFDGDGVTDATGRIASRAFAAGTRTVRLTVTDSLGVSGEATTLVHAGNRIPRPVIAFSPAEPYSGQEVEFLDASSDPDGTVASRSWSFGGGTTSTEARPTHRFPRPGTYVVVLEVTDDDGARVETSVVLVVRNRAPLAAFAAVPDAADPTLVRLREGAVDLDGSVVDWRWDFGDGSSAAVAGPTHRYARPGSYAVTLRVWDDRGATSSVSATVVVPTPVNPAWLSIPLAAGILAVLGLLGFLRRRARVAGSASPPKLFALLLAAAAVLAAAPPGSSYTESPPIGAPASTHQWIFDRAVDILAADGFSGLADWMDGAFLEEMKRGTIRADRTLVDSGDHYHDPWTHAGLAGFRDAADLASEEFGFAAAAWSAGDRLGAAYHLGWAAHLVADATVPHHARLTPLDYHAEYEAFVSANRESAAVDSGGNYTVEFLAGHHEDTWDPWDWVDGNAHRSHDWFPNVSTGDPADFRAAMDVLLPIAQRTTAGFVHMFFATVNAPPQVRIAGPTEATVGVPFSPVAVVDEDIAIWSYAWTADGRLETDREAAFEFAAPGPHLIRLEVQDVLGVTAEATYAVDVAYPQGPRATISGPTRVDSGEAAAFGGVESGPDVVRYEWRIDGAVASLGPSLAASFEGTRVALVELRVWDSRGRTDSVAYPVAVEDRLPPLLDVPERVAVVAGEPLLLAADRHVSGGSLARAIWCVDGEVREATNTTVLFAQPGTHVVVLVAFDAEGNAATDFMEVAVSPPGFPWWIAGIAAVLVAVVAAHLWRRRRQS